MSAWPPAHQTQAGPLLPQAVPSRAERVGFAAVPSPLNQNEQTSRPKVTISGAVKLFMPRYAYLSRLGLDVALLEDRDHIYTPPNTPPNAHGVSDAP